MKIFDAHFHIIDPAYPLAENNGYLPESFTIENYKQTTQGVDITGGTIVSGSFQAFDQNYLINSLKTLGSEYYGIANIPHNILDTELERLCQANIVGVRFNLKRGGSEKQEHIITISNKLSEQYGWHTELYVDSKHLNELKQTLEAIPRFSIDHLGLSKDGLKDLYYWVEKGAKVKATGFGRLDFSPIPVMKQIHDINPEALIFGTDLPSTRAEVPFSINDLNLIKENFSGIALENILYNNAMLWYGDHSKQKSHS